MKYLLAILILFSISTYCLAEYDCEKGEGEIETVNKIEGKVLKTIKLENNTEFIFCETNLCEDYRLPVLLYIKKNNKIYRAIQLTEVYLQEKKVHHPAPNYYYFDCYTGGNSINAENRKALIVEDGGIFYFAGYFSGYEDIDTDGVDDFFIWKLSKTGRDHASHEYEKAKMILQNNVLTMPNTKNS